MLLPDCLNQSDEFPTTSSLGVGGRHPRLATRFLLFLLGERVRERVRDGRSTLGPGTHRRFPPTPRTAPLGLSATLKCHTVTQSHNIHNIHNIYAHEIHYVYENTKSLTSLRRIQHTSDVN